MTSLSVEPLSAQKSSSSNSPKSPWNSTSDAEKSKKYDRQLRLWGDEGQSRIEQARVCMINADVLGCEVLKSLVLPGIGSFTLIDANKVTNDDSCNFFVSRNSLGESRSKVCTQLLTELNPDVRGDHIEESLEVVLDSNPKLFANFSVVIASNVWQESILGRLSKLLWQLDVPLVVCYSLGFIGSIQVQVKEHPVIESHPDYVLEDLRLDDPFPELKEFLETNGRFETMPGEDVSHTPYLAVVYKYLKEWQNQNQKPGNILPSNFREKQQLKHLISEGMNSVRELLQQDDESRDFSFENFEEAIKAINQVLVASNYIPSETKRLLNDSKAISTHQLNESDGKSLSTQNQFWLLMRALREFLSQSDGRLPLRGSLPDMTSDTSRYIQLQNIYTKKSREDRELLASIVKELCIQHGLSTETVSESTLKIFAHCCHCLRLTRTRPVYEEFELKQHTERAAQLCEVINRSSLDGDLETDDLIFHLMIRAVSRFHTQYNHFPGNDQVESDVLTLKNMFKQLLVEFGCSRLSKDDFIHEMCRYGGSELHSVSAFVGGTVAQEVIKLITAQYTPLNNLLIYNAITSVTTAYEW